MFDTYHISSIYNAGNQLYFGTSNGHLLVFNCSNNDLYKFSFQNTSPINHMASNKNGALFLGTENNGVFEYNENTGQVSTHFDSPNLLNVLRMYADSKGMIWVESATAGISKINSFTREYKHYEQTLDVGQDLRPTSQCGFMEDEDKTLWMTLKGGGFGYYNEKNDSLEYFYNKPGDPKSKISNFVNCFYKDDSGVLWISTYFKGIEKVTFIQNKFKFTQLSPQANFSVANEIRAMLEDSEGMLWVATKNQELFLLDKEYHVVKKIDHLDGKQTGPIYALLEDSYHNIYLGTKGNGLFKLKHKSKFEFEVEHFSHNPKDIYSLSSDNIYSLLEDSYGHLWIGTYGGGVNLLQNNQFLNPGNALENYPHGQCDMVRHIVEDHKGNIWIGTTHGLLFVNPTEKLPPDYDFEFYSKAKGNATGLQSNDIFWVFSDENEGLWVGSLGGGLSKLTNYPNDQDPLIFSTKTSHDGLPSDVIFTITEDEYNTLWMSTENGIVNYNPKNGVFRNYNQFDGIHNEGFSEAALATRANGDICFGSYKGLYSFHPSEFSKEPKKVNIVFTGFYLFGKEISPGKESILKKSMPQTAALKLKHNQNIFDISWASLDFKLQDKVHYAYMLEGFDNDWHYISGQNRASYTKLPPGEYSFHVKFQNPELQEFNPPETIEIIISPPFWKTAWAYAIYVVLVLIIVEIARQILSSWFKLRNKLVVDTEISHAKLNFFTNISHELRTPLTLILGPANALKTDENLSLKGQTYARLIEQNAKRLLRVVNQLLDFGKIQNNQMELSLKEVNLMALINSVCRNFDELAREKNIHFSIKSSRKNIVVNIDEEKIDSVIFNLLSNAFKFTPDGGLVDVVVSETPGSNKVSIEISDSGTGIPKEKEELLFKIFASHHDGQEQQKYSGTGIGLILSKEFVKLHHGELTYRPSEAGGATFSIQLDTIYQPSQEFILSDENYNGTLQASLKQDEALINADGKLPGVLIVEDNNELRAFLHLQLNKDYGVVEAVNGREGLKKALKYQPQVILSDVIMPEMNGLELLDNIKSNFETSHIPVILLTAKVSVSKRTGGLGYDADAYITKPFHTDQLKTQLDQLIQARLSMCEIYAKQNGNHISPPFSMTEKDAQFIEKISEIIEENLASYDFDLKDTYKLVGIDRGTFLHKLKGLTGLAADEFIENYRLYKAHSYLHNSKYNVVETAHMTGFSDPDYFSKSYKDKFGKNPSQKGQD